MRKKVLGDASAENQVKPIKPETTPGGNVEPSKETWKQFWQESNGGNNLTEEIINKNLANKLLSLQKKFLIKLVKKTLRIR